jgi:hypothetical protein
VVEAAGRRLNYRLAGPEVGALVEALERLAPALPVWSLEQSQRARAHREARVCYDHVAGRLGVEVMRRIVERRRLEPVDGAAEFDAGEVRYAITVEGGAFLEALGVTVPPSGDRCGTTRTPRREAGTFRAPWAVPCSRGSLI